MELIVKEDKVVCENEEGKEVGVVDFPSIDENTVDINHTFVDDSLRGTGMAGKLLEAAAKHIEAQGKKAVPTCSYAVRWFARHPEYETIVKR